MGNSIIEIMCEYCGTQNPLDEEFCSNCGMSTRMKIVPYADRVEKSKKESGNDVQKNSMSNQEKVSKDQLNLEDGKSVLPEKTVSEIIGADVYREKQLHNEEYRLDDETQGKLKRKLLQDAQKNAMKQFKENYSDVDFSNLENEDPNEELLSMEYLIKRFEQSPPEKYSQDMNFEALQEDYPVLLSEETDYSPKIQISEDFFEKEMEATPLSDDTLSDLINLDKSMDQITEKNLAVLNYRRFEEEKASLQRLAKAWFPTFDQESSLVASEKLSDDASDLQIEAVEPVEPVIRIVPITEGSFSSESLHEESSETGVNFVVRLDASQQEPSDMLVETALSQEEKENQNDVSFVFSESNGATESLQEKIDDLPKDSFENIVLEQENVAKEMLSDQKQEAEISEKIGFVEDDLSDRPFTPLTEWGKRSWESAEESVLQETKSETLAEEIYETVVVKSHENHISVEGEQPVSVSKEEFSEQFEPYTEDELAARDEGYDLLFDKQEEQSTSVEKLYGIDRAKVESYLGRNEDYYLFKFNRIEHKNQLISLNGAGFLLGGIWLLYRKQYLLPMLMYLASMVSIVFYPPAILLMPLICRIIAGFFGNVMYYRYVRRQIEEERFSKKRSADVELPENGGRSLKLAFAYVFTGIVLTAFASVTAYYFRPEWILLLNEQLQSFGLWQIPF